MVTTEQSIYLGDGVYVSFTGYDFKLYTKRESGEHYIFLEPNMIEALHKFYTSIATRSKVVPHD